MDHRQHQTSKSPAWLQQGILLVLAFLAINLAVTLLYRKDIISGTQRQISLPAIGQLVRCNRLLLTKGLIDEEKRTWIPPAPCEWFDFDRRSIPRCIKSHERLGSADVWFIGDSRIRNLFYFFANKTGGFQIPKKLTQHRDFIHPVSNTSTKIKFTWDPKLDIHLPKIMDQLLTMTEEQRPYMILISTGLWFVVEKLLQQYAHHMARVSSLLNKVANSTKINIIWVLNDPVKEGYSTAYHLNWTNSDVEILNDSAIKNINNTKVLVWFSSREVSIAMHEMRDQVHMSDRTLRKKATLLMNIYCQGI